MMIYTKNRHTLKHLNTFLQNIHTLNIMYNIHIVREHKQKQKFSLSFILFKKKKQDIVLSVCLPTNYIY